MTAAYSMPLSDLLPGATGVNPVITGMSLDSRAIGDGDLFMAVAGQAAHGLRFWIRRSIKVAAPVFMRPKVRLQCGQTKLHCRRYRSPN